MEAKQPDQSKPMDIDNSGVKTKTKTYHIPDEIPESELEECFLRIKSTFNDYGVSCTRDKRIITFLYTRRSLLPDIFGNRKSRTRNPAISNKASHLLRNYGPSLNEDSILKIPFSHVSDKKRVTKLQEAWPMVESALKKHGISCTLDLAEHCMTVSTISSTMNPDNFDKARDVLELLSTTHAPPSLAIEILSGNMRHDLFKIGDQEGGLCSILAIKKEQFVKQWECLSCSLQALAEMGGCNLFLNENTLFAVGITSQGLKVIRMVVERCIIDNLCPAAVVINSKIILETCTPMDDFEDPHVKHMQMEKSGSSLNENGMLEFASFYTLLHESQVTELKEVWQMVESCLEAKGISCTLNLAEGSMTLSTTKSRDPDTIDVAWDHLELLSTTNVPASMLIELLAGSMQYDLIKTGYQFGGIRSKFEINKVEVAKLKQESIRDMGFGGVLLHSYSLKSQEEWCRWERYLRRTLQGVALFVNCQVFITGNTITAVGTSPEGLKKIRNFVEDPFAKNPLRMD